MINYALKFFFITLKGISYGKKSFLLYRSFFFKQQLCIFYAHSNQYMSKMWANLYLPQILSGASNSRRIGCDRKISRDFRHNPRISASVSWTFLPGRAPRTVAVVNHDDIDIDEICRCWFTYQFFIFYMHTCTSYMCVYVCICVDMEVRKRGKKTNINYYNKFPYFTRNFSQKR